MPRVYVQEYRDQFDHTNYPFSDDASLEGTIKLPQELFVDASFYIPEVTSTIYLSKIQVLDDRVLLTVTDVDDLHNCTGAVTDFDQDTVDFFEGHGFKVGCMVFGTATPFYLRSLNRGTYTFYSDATELCARCCIPTPNIGVTSLTTQDAAEVLYGDVWLVGGQGVILDCPDDDHTVRINIVGDPCYKRCDCTGEQFPTANYIRSINGKQPDVYGNINITSDENPGTIRVITKENSVVIKSI